MSNAIDRRRILGGLAAIAAVPGCATSRSASAQVVPVASAGSTASAGPAAPAASTAPAAASKYPPLPPLGDATFARRHDSLRALARQAGASLVFVTSGTTSFAYLAGGRVERSERLI